MRHSLILSFVIFLSLYKCFTWCMHVYSFSKLENVLWATYFQKKRHDWSWSELRSVCAATSVTQHWHAKLYLLVVALQSHQNGVLSSSLQFFYHSFYIYVHVVSGAGAFCFFHLFTLCLGPVDNLTVVLHLLPSKSTDLKSFPSCQTQLALMIYQRDGFIPSQ